MEEDRPDGGDRGVNRLLDAISVEHCRFETQLEREEPRLLSEEREAVCSRRHWAANSKRELSMPIQRGPRDRNAAQHASGHLSHGLASQTKAASAAMSPTSLQETWARRCPVPKWHIVPADDFGMEVCESAGTVAARQATWDHEIVNAGNNLLLSDFTPDDSRSQNQNVEQMSHGNFMSWFQQRAVRSYRSSFKGGCSLPAQDDASVSTTSSEPSGGGGDFKVALRKRLLEVEAADDPTEGGAVHAHHRCRHSSTGTTSPIEQHARDAHQGAGVSAAVLMGRDDGISSPCSLSSSSRSDQSPRQQQGIVRRSFHANSDGRAASSTKSHTSGLSSRSLSDDFEDVRRAQPRSAGRSNLVAEAHRSPSASQPSISQRWSGWAEKWLNSKELHDFIDTTSELEALRSVRAARLRKLEFELERSRFQART